MAGKKSDNNLKGWLYLLPALLFLGVCRVVHRGLVGESSQIWGEESAGGPADGSRPEGSLLSGILEVIVQGPSRCDWGFRLFKWKAVGLPAT